MTSLGLRSFSWKRDNVIGFLVLLEASISLFLGEKDFSSVSCCIDNFSSVIRRVFYLLDN